MNHAPPCPHCGFVHHCLCPSIPTIDSQIPISLLIHDKECKRPTNTGQWLSKMLPHCKCFRWQRQQPSPELQNQLKRPEYMPFIVFPDDSGVLLHDANVMAQQHHKRPHFIILDGTWQEARKMNRRSSWLASMLRVQITPSAPSEYSLRRNQQSQSLCTMEIARELLAQSGEKSQALEIHEFFKLLMQTYQAEKCNHR